MSGWVKAHRALLDWEWFTDVNTTHLFLYLLLAATHVKTKWRGIDLNPGDIITGRIKISKDTGLSERMVRTSLNKLKTTGELTSKITNKYSIISIANWEKFQGSDQQVDQQATSKRPASDHIQEDKEIKNVKKEERNNKKGARLKSETLPDEWIEFCKTEMGWNIPQCESAWVNFKEYWLGENCKNPLKKDWFQTFKNSCRSGITKPNINLTNKGTNNARPSAVYSGFEQKDYSAGIVGFGPNEPF